MDDMDLHKRYMDNREQQLITFGAIMLLFLVIAVPNAKNIQDNLAVIQAAYDENTGTVRKITCAPEPLTQFGKKPSKERAAQAALGMQNAMKELRAAHDKAKAGKNKYAAEELQRVAQARKHAFVEAMRENPTAAMFGVALPEERDAIAEVSYGCVEQKVAKEGKLEVLHADFFDDKKSVEQYTLVTKQNERIVLHSVRGFKKNLVSGTEVRVAGLQLGDALLLDGATTAQAPSGELGGMTTTQAVADSPPVYGDQKTLVLLVAFQNAPQPGLPLADVTAAMQQVEDYYADSSYGQVSLSGVIDPSAPADVLGWYPMPINQTCSFNTVQTAAINAAEVANPSIDFTSYGRLMIVADFPACGWAGSASFGKSLIQTPDGQALLSTSLVQTNSAAFMRIPGHEMGHNFGNYHANYLYTGNYLPCIPGGSTVCTNQEYGDYYSIMGTGVNASFNALHREQTGWLTAGGNHNIQTVTTNGRYSIEPIELFSSGIQALKIPRNNGEFFWIEYRQPIGFVDDEIAITTGDLDIIAGAFYHTTMDGIAGRSGWIKQAIPGGFAIPNPDETDDEPFITLYERSTFISGDTFVDPANGTRITTISATPTALEVDVTIGKTDFTPPTVSVTAPAYDASFGGNDTITITGDAQDASGIEKIEFYLYENGTPTLLSTDTSHPYEATMNANTRPDGFTYFFARAYDLSGAHVGFPGNTGDSPLHRIVIDRTPPLVYVFMPTLPPPRTAYSGTIDVTVGAEDPSGIDRIEFYKNGEVTPFQSITTTRRITLDTATIPDGSHTFLVKAFDMFQNAGEATTSALTDNTPPTATLVSPSLATHGKFLKGSVSLAASASDPTGIQRVEFYRDSASALGTDTSTPFTGTFDTTLVPDGPHTVYARAFNFAGLPSSSVPFQMITDNMPPTVSISSPASGAEVAGIVAIEAYPTDTMSGITRVDFYRDANILLGSAALQPAPHALLDCQFEDNTRCVGGDFASELKGISFANGKYGKSIFLSGSTLVFSYPAAGNFNAQEGTLDFWVRPNFDPNAPGATGNIFNPRTGGDAKNNPFLYYNASFKELRLEVQKQSGSCITKHTDIRTWNWGPSADWHRVTAAWNATSPSKSLELFLDGKPGSTVSCTGGNGWTPTAPDTLFLGGGQLIGAPTNAWIDGLRIFDATLSPNAVPNPTSHLSTYSWNSSSVLNGTYTLSAKATDYLGHTSFSPSITVEVLNAVGTINPGGGKKQPIKETQ